MRKGSRRDEEGINLFLGTGTHRDTSRWLANSSRSAFPRPLSSDARRFCSELTSPRALARREVI